MLDDQAVAKIANESYMQFMSEAYKSGVVVDPAQAKELMAYVNKVGFSVLKASGLASKQQWEFIVIKSNVVNAQVLPNGKIIVYTGILPVAKNEAGLAAIIGHEIAHVSSKHMAERLSQTMLTDVGLYATNEYLDRNKTKYNKRISAVLEVGVEYGLILPYSRLQENEADVIGQIYMAKAGYDPRESILLWQRMDAVSKNQLPEFMSTHPSNNTRIQNLKASLALANMYYVDQMKPLPFSIAQLKQDYKRSLQHLSETAKGTDKINIRAGYWYTFRKSDTDASITVRYTASKDCEGESSCLLATLSTGEKRYMINDFGLHKAEYPDGSWTKFSPPLAAVQYPLAPNKVWVDRVTKTTSAGQSVEYTSESRVVDYAEVPAASGTVWAYRVIKTSNGKKFFDGWWAPSLCSFVSTTQSVDGKAVDAVLLDYKGSNDRRQNPVEACGK